MHQGKDDAYFWYSGLNVCCCRRYSEITVWCLWALGKKNVMFFNAFLLIPFCHVAAAVSHQVKGICLVLGMCCSSCSPCRAASVQAVPTLLCCLGSEQSSRAVCWLFTHFTVENSSMSVSYRKRINISFKWSGLVGRKQVIL